jgi:hypothetical protein
MEEIGFMVESLRSGVLESYHLLSEGSMAIDRR